MGRLLVLTLAGLALATAGCLEAAGAEPPAVVAPGPEPLSPPLPEGFTQTGAIAPSLYNPGGYCQGPHACAEHGFAVDDGWAEAPRQVVLRAVLTWGLPGNELDLVLFRGSTEVAADYGLGLGRTAAEITATLEPGDYTLLVDSYTAVGADEYEIVVSFEATETQD